MSSTNRSFSDASSASFSQSTSIHEPVDVFCFFTRRSPLPLKLIWRNKSHHVRNLNLTYEEKQGTDTIFYFSVSNDEASFKLSFNNQSLRWYLEEVFCVS